jgi:hypothetical protein
MIEYLPLVLTGIGLTASILYYAIILRNANKTQQMQLETRQVQIFMTISETRSNPMFQKLIYKVTFIDKWKDLDDYFNRYGPENNLDAYSEHAYVWQLFDTIGFLLTKKIIDVSFLDDLLKTTVLAAWSKFEPIIKTNRKRANQPNLWNQFEFLAVEIKKTQQ